MFNSKLSASLRGNKNAAGKRIGSAVQSLKIKASGIKNTVSEAAKAADKVQAKVRPTLVSAVKATKQKTGEIGANVGNKLSIAKSAIKGDKAGLAKAKTMNSTFDSNMKARDEAIKRNKRK